jgi:transposase
MTRLADTVDGVIGVDTHRDTLAAAATDRVGGILAQTAAAADLAGYQALLDFAQAQLPGRRCWAVEGAGSYGAGPDRLPAGPRRAGGRDWAAQAVGAPHWR